MTENMLYSEAENFERISNLLKLVVIKLAFLSPNFVLNKGEGIAKN